MTGGIAEMFLSWTKERIVAPRPNFARIALEVSQVAKQRAPGPTFGATSRTHTYIRIDIAAIRRIRLYMR